jgi:hypothetical protein
MIPTQRPWCNNLLATLVVTLACAGSAAAQPFDGERDPQPERATLAIVGGLLIDGHEGPPLPGGIVLVDGNRIVAAGSREASMSLTARRSSMPPG